MTPVRIVAQESRHNLCKRESGGLHGGSSNSFNANSAGQQQCWHHPATRINHASVLAVVHGNMPLVDSNPFRSPCPAADRPEGSAAATQREIHRSNNHHQKRAGSIPDSTATRFER